jgi:hypothetical protein
LFSKHYYVSYQRREEHVKIGVQELTDMEQECIINNKVKFGIPEGRCGAGGGGGGLKLGYLAIMSASLFITLVSKVLGTSPWAGVYYWKVLY